MNLDMNLDTNMNLDSIINERVIQNFTIGIPILKKDELYSNSDIRKKNFDDAVYKITEELSKITDGLTYQKCYGTWVNNENKSHLIERTYSVIISIIVLPENAINVYNATKRILSDANISYNLGIIHVQAMKTFGYAEHFIV